MKTTRYGLVGNGLLANHLKKFLDLEGIEYLHWSRKENQENPWEILKECRIVLIVIKDSNIENFISQNPKLKEKTLVHFSGSITVDGTYGFHPLMTFGEDLYSLESYREIPFIGCETIEKFREIFPELKNCYYTIDKSQKELYHALCVIGGNFTTILWQKVIDGFTDDLKLPKKVLNPYLNQVCTNIMTDHVNALTGPIKRGDKLTIKKNISALKDRSWKRVYKMFNSIYKGRKR
ncbi:DUF2520 domain-containing protein [Thiospirochaeta perfilievii]|uniref:DUF2520 domain-containing protein n=1 Tax=Thiospirochaeta perfilievii TaxID=252967 RepID=A0A5C1QAY6_9SPIO|nr:DUF2520 domain-containing protein [Thiospirochaeta perfilievii]QEN04518.1 DUF2520 domain-containing protein [Thiospirochaeta perfilievii]